MTEHTVVIRHSLFRLFTRSISVFYTEQYAVIFVFILFYFFFYLFIYLFIYFASVSKDSADHDNILTMSKDSVDHDNITTMYMGQRLRNLENIWLNSNYCM